jgi:alpha-beta hydrolase superfamily lysophospholipase
MTTLFNQFKEGVPTFLYGFSMGCMVINTYLLANPDLKIDGVIFESPFFKMGRSMNMDPVREFLSRLIRPLLQNFVINVPFKMQEMSRNGPWVRSMV